MPAESVATAVAFRKSRRRMVMSPLPHAELRQSAYLHLLPERLLRRRLVDRGLGQRFGFLCGLDGLVEIAGIAGLLGGGQSRGRGGPLVAQLAGFGIRGFG